MKQCVFEYLIAGDTEFKRHAIVAQNMLHAVYQSFDMFRAHDILCAYIWDEHNIRYTVFDWRGKA